MLRLILTLLFLLIFFIISIPLFLIEWIISKINKKAADTSSLKIVQAAFKGVAFFSGIKLTVKGEENIPTDESVLYVGNHRSFFDIVVTYPICKNLTGYIAKEGIFKVPILGTWMKRLYCLALNRENTREALKTILKAIEYIKSGISVCIFPEGTRSHDPENLLPFKEGSLKIAEKTGCAIVPFAICGSDDVFENHFPWIYSTNVIVEYGKPIYPKELDAEAKKNLGAYTQDIIQRMYTANRNAYLLNK
ncbi:MAG: 1-acyl-sn-glycerol-3-phosphate acyltransferase [Eubacterium sp.]|nr:1-acyl-sn-glycerol-3-phosphate acyltransferase [Eubacterium sp.]